MPPYEWGIIKTPYSPRPDLVAANHGKSPGVMLESRNVQISTIDPVRQSEVDNFYRVRRIYYFHTTRHFVHA